MMHSGGDRRDAIATSLFPYSGFGNGTSKDLRKQVKNVVAFLGEVFSNNSEMEHHPHSHVASGNNCWRN